MKDWGSEIKKLKEKRKRIDFIFEKDRETLINKIVPSITDELPIICKELLRDYKGLVERTPLFSGEKILDLGNREKYYFYLWEIYLGEDDLFAILKNDVFAILTLCGSKDYPFPHMLRLESADNYKSNYRATWWEEISSEGLRSLFTLQLEKMGFQNKKFKDN